MNENFLCSSLKFKKIPRKRKKRLYGTLKSSKRKMVKLKLLFAQAVGAQFVNTKNGKSIFYEYSLKSLDDKIFYREDCNI